MIFKATTLKQTESLLKWIPEEIPSGFFSCNPKILPESFLLYFDPGIFQDYLKWIYCVPSSIRTISENVWGIHKPTLAFRKNNVDLDKRDGFLSIGVIIIVLDCNQITRKLTLYTKFKKADRMRFHAQKYLCFIKELLKLWVTSPNAKQNLGDR
ncbi:hypothetical protein NPIL_71131 [Nephila pilipes]|uniref:Uncharacterized protein n=1 Tax=Nephila pilipes TaxID=299642 RepID=A0A8X6MUU4_NEPPI|nr:hypothetical protein NPIL_71131 [Nephila pilipes]